MRNIRAFLKIDNIRHGDIVFSDDQIFVVLDVSKDVALNDDISNILEENKKLKQLLKQYEL